MQDSYGHTYTDDNLVLLNTAVQVVSLLLLIRKTQQKRRNHLTAFGAKFALAVSYLKHCFIWLNAFLKSPRQLTMPSNNSIPPTPEIQCVIAMTSLLD